MSQIDPQSGEDVGARNAYSQGESDERRRLARLISELSLTVKADRAELAKLAARITALEAAQRPLTGAANKTANDAMWQSAAKAAIEPDLRPRNDGSYELPDGAMEDSR